MDDWKEQDLEEDWRNAILKEAAGGPRAKQIADRLPAYRLPTSSQKRTPAQRKKRKRKRKATQASRRRNR
jgi:cell division protein FtsL